MKKYLKIVAVAAALVLAVTALTSCGKKDGGEEKKAESGKSYVAVMEPTFPPFDTTTEEGDLDGFDVDLMNAIAEDQGFEVEWKSMEFDSLIPAINAGNADIIASGMNGDNEERREKVDFTDPYYPSGLVVMVKEDNKDITGEDSLTKDMKVASQTGTTGADEAKALKEDGKIKEAVIVNGFDNCVLQLKNGDVAAVIIDKPVAESYMKKNEGVFKIVGDTLNAERYAFAVKKGNTELRDQINEGMKNLVENGKFQEICDKWEIGNMYAEDK